MKQVRLGKQRVSHLVKKFPAFSESWRLITVFKRASPYPEPDVSTPHFPSYLPKIQSHVIYHPRLGVPSGPFPLGFPGKILYAFLNSTKHYWGDQMKEGEMG
jgi:hypothetical protein